MMNIQILLMVCFGASIGCQNTEEKSAACLMNEEIVQECMDIDIDCGDPESVVCSYNDITVNSSSCNCNSKIYQAICDAGITDSLEELEAGISCAIVEEE